MDLTTARGLALIDRQIGLSPLPPAEYEIARKVILATGDFDYRSLIGFSPRAIVSGAAALAARSPIVVDVEMVKVGILPFLQETFVNPVYCCWDDIPDQDIRSLIRRYPEGIFAIGESLPALTTLIEAIESGDCQPALAIVTPAGWIEAKMAKERVKDSGVSYISIEGGKGSAAVAVAIVNALAELAWQIHR
ncbi:precorrin-8X methylmutase [Pannus brasiliensis CCIBt3594]|uniref:Precorrin-8X methylmutase n=1 Tax=Pannus brasiliensis CCIBt3594 TaxID=1427578 RepID=A0AAW9QZH3_9CHRO